MSRNIVLCCDGTSNQFSKDRTSVIKLFHALVKKEGEQLVYYHPGIGTRAPSGIGTQVGGMFARIAGLAFGYRLQDDIVDAYRFLMNNYEDGDRIFIFGFSRGAYTARVVSAMLHLYGLAMRGNDPLVPYAVEMLWAMAKAKEGAPYEACAQLARDFKKTISSRECKTHFLGVWDTVNSVGWIGSPLKIPFGRYNPDVEIVRHAKALDERRGFFRVNWFAEDATRDIQEVWFPGTHCDVGGGWPEAESGMSKYPLAWMAKEAVKAGLLVDQSRMNEVLGLSPGPYAAATPTAPLHLWMGFSWALTEFVPKKHWNFKKQCWEWRANLFRRRSLPSAPVVHDVAWDIPGYAVPEGALKLSVKYP
ncbi:DUF2235 domain-containing protein [Insolitispirillum peregrinum]|uniref:Uncharacterized protein, PA2063/DUF2235 family n=1 Tax=Insolitispirillum peregrinum TaxID=80876 RepID=A0A1N7PVL5_9PROT|nr:DUF2235 domain-containing protein [Insolitispirillum peregrinum]SIT14487.1 Uncharacterized protein, PA2063/DUF2235 family [Insolitispirillum peregrinum]